MMNKGFSRHIQLLVIVSAVFLSNGCGSHSSSNPAPPDTTAPSVPIYLTAVAASSTRVSLRWLASTDDVGVTAYIINRNGSQLATTTTATTVYSDATCTANNMYIYTVAAHDAAGNASTPSSSATTTTIPGGLSDNQPPTEPANLTASATSSGQISLHWVAATDNIGVSGYNIYRATSLSGPFVLIGTTTTISFIDTGLTSGTQYYYYVRAFDGVPTLSLGTSNILPATPQ